MPPEIEPRDTVFIMAGGQGTRWADPRNPKHLVRIPPPPESGGERLLDRTVRLVREIRPEARLVVVGSDKRYRSPPAELIQPLGPPAGQAVLGADKFLSARRHWPPGMHTWLLYGDVWFSDLAMRTILERIPDAITWLGRFGRSAHTQTKAGEMFAVQFHAGGADQFERACRHCAALEVSGAIANSGGWRIYRHLNGLPLERHFIGEHFIDVNDWTDDFDSKPELEDWLAARAASRQPEIANPKPQMEATMPPVISPTAGPSKWELADPPIPGWVGPAWDGFLAAESRRPSLAASLDDLFASSMFPLQRRREMERMLALAPAAQVLLDVGSDKGGGIYAWIKALPGLRRIAVCEIRGCPYAAAFQRHFPQIDFLFLQASSYDPRTVAKIRRWLAADRFDLAFLDGDKGNFHKDVAAYEPLVRSGGGYLCLHDVNPGPHDEPPPVKVWRELSGRHASASLIYEPAEGLAAQAWSKAHLGVKPHNSYDGWLRIWGATSCGVGVIRK